MSDWNTAIIEEFRANEGRVGGDFEGAPLTLLHHTGRKSGKEFVAPMMYLPGASDDVIFVFASKAGAPDNPDWYENLVARGPASVEVGTSRWPVSVRDLVGSERDEVFATQAALYPGFADYAVKTAGIRVIPVLELTRTCSPRAGA